MKSADVTGKMRRCGVADFWHTAGSTCFWLPRTFLQVYSNAYLLMLWILWNLSIY